MGKGFKLGFIIPLIPYFKLAYTHLKYKMKAIYRNSPIFINELQKFNPR